MRTVSTEWGLTKFYFLLPFRWQLRLVVICLFLYFQVHVFGYGADKDGNWSHYWEKLHNKKLKTGVHPGSHEYGIIQKLAEQIKLRFYPGWWSFSQHIQTLIADHLQNKTRLRNLGFKAQETTLLWLTPLPHTLSLCRLKLWVDPWSVERWSKELKTVEVV